MSTTHHIWGSHIILPDGHRLFPAEPSTIGAVLGHPLIAIADDSGDYPQDTDDGILWLDFERNLMMVAAAGKDDFSIPVLTPDSQPSRTISDAATLVFLSARYSWHINVNGILMHTAYAYPQPRKIA